RSNTSSFVRTYSYKVPMLKPDSFAISRVVALAKPICLINLIDALTFWLRRFSMRELSFTEDMMASDIYDISPFYHLFRQCAADDETLNFVRSFVNLGDFCITHVTFNQIIFRVTVSSENLHRFDRYAHRRISGKQFGHGGRFTVWKPLAFQPCCTIRQETGRFDFCRHVR